MGALRLGAHTQYVVTLGLVPLTMLLFAQVSLVSPIANAVAIPLVSFVVTPLALAGSMAPAPLSAALLELAHFAVEALARLAMAGAPARWRCGARRRRRRGCSASPARDLVDAGAARMAASLDRGGGVVAAAGRRCRRIRRTAR